MEGGRRSGGRGGRGGAGGERRDCRPGDRRARRGGQICAPAGRGGGRRHGSDRHDEREHAPLTRRALDVDVTAEQSSQVAGDRQPQSRAAVLAVGAAVRLPECLEDDFLLVLRDADAGVVDREGDAAARDRRDAQRDLAALGELDRVRQEVFQHLPETVRIGVDPIRDARLDRGAEAESLFGRQRLHAA
jgi:hypothetical protein